MGGRRVATEMSTFFVEYRLIAAIAGLTIGALGLYSLQYNFSFIATVRPQIVQAEQYSHFNTTFREETGQKSIYELKKRCKPSP